MSKSNDIRDADASICRYKPEGGYCAHKLEAQWIFVWEGALLFVDRLDFGWRVYNFEDGDWMFFDELFAALDWVSEVGGIWKA